MRSHETRPEDVRAAFARWALLQPGAPSDAEALVQSIEQSEIHAGLLSTDIQVREGSFRTVTCPRCAGAKKALCGICGGSGKTICAACKGERKAYAYAANGAYRLLNCSSCRGKGEVDCTPCRRGIVTCPTCAGEGREQRWTEVETGRRSAGRVHPEWVARLLGWGEQPADAQVARDGAVIANVERPQALTAADLGEIPPLWLHHLAPAVQRGEHVLRQRLHIVRIPQFTVRYRLGGYDDVVTFVSGRMIAPPPPLVNLFSQRTARLSSLLWLLIAIFGLTMIVALARGMFYWSVPTLLGLAAVGAALVTFYGAALEWTAARRRMRGPMVLCAAFVVLAVAFGFASAPRLAHATRVLAAGNLDAAEQELRALGSNASPAVWADLRRARAEAQYVPAARSAIDRNDWGKAADLIGVARGAGVTTVELENALRTSGEQAVAHAARETNARERLRLRLAAETILVAWERASGNWGTPALISLRTEMARDVAIVEARETARRK